MIASTNQHPKFSDIGYQFYDMPDFATLEEVVEHLVEENDYTFETKALTDDLTEFEWKAFLNMSARFAIHDYLAKVPQND